jgi:hypothetical protein
MSTLKLSSLNGDFEAIRQQLQTYLASKESWAGTLPTQTGQTIIDFVAAIAAYNSFQNVRSYEDAFPNTSVSDEATYAIASMQGLRIRRKQPASMEAEITVAAPVTVPAYSQFTGGGTFFYNRTALALTPGPAQEVTLHQGRVIDFEINGLGTDFQLFMSQERQFQVSNNDVSVFINGIPIARTEDGLWKLKGVPGFRDRTLPDGRLVIEFGNGTYGSRPSQTDTVRILYTLTSGASANNLNLTSKKFVLDGSPGVVASATENPTNGVDEQGATIYKNVAAATFGNFGSAVTKEQYQATAASYPGVIDAVVLAQRDINPQALQWMNVMRVTLLTTTLWSPGQSQTYINWLQSKTMYSGKFVMDQPLGISTNVSAMIYCFNWANATQAQADAIAAVQALFAPEAGYLGRDLELADIYNAILDSNKGIDYVDIFSPTTNLKVSNVAIDTPAATQITAASALLATTYRYAVGVVTSYGEIAPKNWIEITLPFADIYQVKLDWAAYPNALHYNVYGYRPQVVANQQYRRLGQSLTNTYTDAGNVPVSYIPVPAFSTTPIRYNVLGGIAISVKYTNRTTKG